MISKSQIWTKYLNVKKLTLPDYMISISKTNSNYNVKIVQICDKVIKCNEGMSQRYNINFSREGSVGKCEEKNAILP